MHATLQVAHGSLSQRSGLFSSSTSTFTGNASGVDPAQKVSRFFTGRESPLLTVLVRLVIQHSVDAVPVSLEAYGVQVLVKKTSVDDLLADVARGLKKFNLAHLGCDMRITATSIEFKESRNIKTA